MSVQNYQTVNDLVFRKAKGLKSAQGTPLLAFAPRKKGRIPTASVRTGLGMTEGKGCHCEERSDAAIRDSRLTLVPRRASTIQCRHQNYQAIRTLVSRKAGCSEGPQAPRSGLSSPVPTSLASAQRSARARPPEIPRTLGMVSKGRAAALPLVVSRGPGGKSEIPPEFFFGGLGVYSFNLKRIHPQMPPSILGTPGWSACPPAARRVVVPYAPLSGNIPCPAPWAEHPPGLH